MHATIPNAFRQLSSSLTAHASACIFRGCFVSNIALIMLLINIIRVVGDSDFISTLKKDEDSAVVHPKTLRRRGNLYLIIPSIIGVSVETVQALDLKVGLVSVDGTAHRRETEFPACSR